MDLTQPILISTAHSRLLQPIGHIFSDFLVFTFQEEDRLEKFSKRVQELETVSNNVKLLNEMLIAYHSGLSESEQETMKVGEKLHTVKTSI